MTTTVPQPDEPVEDPEIDVATLAVTANGEPTEEIRALLSDAGYVVMRASSFEVPTLIPPGQTLELGLVVPLLEEAKSLAGKRVVVWIPGGMQVDGALVEIDDEQQTVVVEDDGQRYAIALQSVAVLQSALPKFRQRP